MMTGRRFKRWKVLAEATGRAGFYLCRCDCGTEREVRKDQLTRGVSESCGCLKSEVAREQIVRLSTTHGLSKTRTYTIWKGMWKRCTNPNSKGYSAYGGRGIKVCSRWKKFPQFLADLGDAPEGTSIDRINNDGNYEPTNCRWATKKEQANNTRDSLLYRLDGEVHTLAEWCERFCVPYHRAYQRIFRLHWPIRKALTP